MIRAVLLALAVAGPAFAEGELPEGYPPVMGDVTATVGGTAASWQTYDFSVGAFDASAWVSDTDDKITLRIMAYPAGQPDKMEDRLRIVAEFPLFPSPGSTPDTVLVEVLAGEDIDGKKLTSGATPVAFTLDTFTRESYAYGRTTGSFEAVICLKRSEKAKISAKCKPIKGRFDTSIQFDNM
ncbi:MAG: hypothetical protein ACRC14_12140 [Paracoccaceae bacterium]